MLENIKNYIKDSNYKITLLNNKIDIINYKKIITLENNSILILLNNKKLKIIGNDLKLKKMIDDELLINGIIKKIEVLDEE